jgi:DNA polymerase-3 subunit beta
MATATATKERPSKEKNRAGITLNLNELRRAVKIAGMAVARKSHNSAIANVCIGNGLVTGTDLDCRIDVELIDAQCEPILLPKDRLHTILLNATGDTVTLTPDGSTCKIKAKGCEWKLPTEPASEFPLWEPEDLHPMLAVTGDEFSRAVKSVIYAIDRESSRYALGGVFIECVGNTAFFVATDGRRMSIAEVGREAATDDFVNDPKGTEKKSPIVPTSPMVWLSNEAGSDETVAIECDSKTFRGNVGGITVTCRLIDGRFPRWRDVLGEELPKAHSVCRDDLVHAVSCAAVVATESSKGVRFSFSGDTLTLTAKSSEAGQSEVECRVDAPAEAATVKLDPKYVHSFLKPFGQDNEPCVSIHVCKPDGKTVMKVGDSYTGVIMPLAEDA